MDTFLCKHCLSFSLSHLFIVRREKRLYQHIKVYIFRLTNENIEIHRHFITKCFYIHTICILINNINTCFHWIWVIFIFHKVHLSSFFIFLIERGKSIENFLCILIIWWKKIRIRMLYYIEVWYKDLEILQFVHCDML